MKRVNNCKFKETFPWIWDRFDKIALIESNEYAKSIRLDELYNVTINRHVFQINTVSNRKVFGIITTDTLLALDPKSDVVNNFLKSLLSKEIMTNKEKFDCICGFAECAGLEYLKRSIKDEVKNLFYPSFKIKMNGNNLDMFIIFGNDIGVLKIILNHSGLVLYCEFETDNYVIEWEAEDGCAKLRQFHQDLNSMLSRELFNREHNEI